MSETKTETPANPKPPEAPTPPPAKPPESSKTPELSLTDKVAVKIKKIRSYQLGVELVDENAVPRFKGKPGMNPFLYLAQVVDPIEQHINNALNNGKQPDETLLKDFLTKIPDEVEPSVDKMNLNSKTLKQLMTEFNTRNDKK